MASVMTNLDAVVQTYLNDTEFQQKRLQIVQERDDRTPIYKRILEQFTDADLNLAAFRAMLDKQLRGDACWGDGRWHFVQQINNFAGFHARHIPETEGALRTILVELNATNIGQRIEQFHQKVEMDRKKLLTLPDADSRKMTSPKSAAFIISLFALWVDQKNKPYVYYPSVRFGIALLLKEKLIPIPSGIRQLKGDIEITSSSDHAAVSTLLNVLAAAAPKLQTDTYWADLFLSWIQEQAKKEANFFKNTYVFIEQEVSNEDERVSTLPVEETMVEELTPLSIIENNYLAPTSEPLLTQLIAELRRHILIDESVVRDIYHALLGGHLILTGPPGTGKTELARLIPEILWQSEEIIENTNAVDGQMTKRLTTHTAYTTTLVTATADWSTRTLISSIMPIVRGEKVFYHTQYGHLILAILRNWTADPLTPEYWEKAQRIRSRAKSLSNSQQEEDFHGHWLIIDEFNRAPIDIALGEAMTALSSGEALQLLIAGKSVKLPLPKDFRIIGTLNSFDRHYLNQISEALKRRFTFVEILPPSRVHRGAEQAMVLYKALKDVTHINYKIELDEARVMWWEVVGVYSDTFGTYHDEWKDQEHPLRKVFYDTAWPLFEVIRIYRQLGTAQAIALVRQVLIRGILEEYNEPEQWQTALDTAFSNVIADQLQVLLPDELDVLLWHLKLEKEAFIQKYHMFISDLGMKRRRVAAHLEVLHRVVNSKGEPLLSDEAIERLLDEEEELSLIVPEILTPEFLTEAFHLDHPPYKLPQFMRRLRTFKAEQGL